MKENFIQKVKERGYWRVNFRPRVIKDLSLPQCLELVDQNSVTFRGWDYPHIPRRNGEDTGVDYKDNHVQGWCDWQNHKEFWCLYQSTQFLHYIGLREDWLEDDSWSQDLAKKIKPMKKLGTVGVIYELTEIFEFLARLTRAGLYSDGVEVQIALHNAQDRELWLEDSGRVPFSQSYKTSALVINYTKIFTKGEVEDSVGNAWQGIKYIFERFGWMNPSRQIIASEQEKLINRRF